MKIQIALSSTSIVFHYTSYQKLLSMLSSGSLMLTPSESIGADAAVGNRRPYFLSTTRSRVGDYHRSAGDSQYPATNAVLLILDGRKLGTRLSSAPVDYWGPDYRARDPQKNEMEERFWSQSPKIQLWPYLLGVDILNPKTDAKQWLQVKLAQSRHGFDLRCYAYGKDWLYGTKRTVTPRLDPKKEKQDPYRFVPPEKRNQFNRERAEKAKKGDAELSTLQRLLGFLIAGRSLSSYDPDSAASQLTDYWGQRLLSSIRYGEAGGLAAAFHNASRQQGQLDWVHLSRIIQMCKKIGAPTDPRALIKWLADKQDSDNKEWRRTHPDF